MLKIKFIIWKQELQKLCNLNFEDFTEGMIAKVFKEALINVVNSYEQKWKEEGVPNAIIDKFNNAS